MSRPCPDFLNHSMRKLASKEEINFCEAFAGKTLLIVNTASYCGFTPQLEGLETLQEQYRDKGLVVLGFSSDEFWQEDAEENKAAEICFENYKVSFPIMATSAVRGKEANPVFRGLGEAKGYPLWNFYKYLVNTDGKVLNRFSSRVHPDSSEMLRAIERALTDQST